MPRKAQPKYPRIMQTEKLRSESPGLCNQATFLGPKSKDAPQRIHRVHFGRLQHTDKRDKDYPVRKLLPKAAPLPNSKFWPDTKWFGNQGQTSQCVAYAFSHWLCDGPIYPDKFPPIAPATLYKKAQQLDEWFGDDYEGTSVRGGAKALQALDYILSYYWAFTVEQMVSTILTTGPMVVGTNWYSGMMRPKSGFIRIGGDVIGGHAYCINGCNRVAGYFRIKNSWGQSWGDNGRTKISFEDMARLLREKGEACIAVENSDK